MQVALWIAKANLISEQYLFPSRQKESPHITTRQYARIVHRWVKSIGFDTSDYGTHTMRRTKATLIYRQTKNLRAIQLLLGHSKLDYVPFQTMSRRFTVAPQQQERCRKTADIVSSTTGS